MRLIIIGAAPEGHWLEIDSEFAGIVITTPDNLDMVKDAPVAITLYAKPKSLDDTEDLDFLSTLEISEDPEMLAAEVAQAGDYVYMGWDDSPRHHAILRSLQGRGVLVFDMLDDYQQLVLDENPALEEMVKAMTAKITADVLKVVRAEMAELSRTRRYRPTTPKV